MFTHTDLCQMAVRWLKRQGCGVVITEMSSHASEEPDAIGWKYGVSALVECKVSRSDFLKDKKKLHRMASDLGMGCWRFYLCPPDIIKEKDLPEGWGLLYAHNKRKIEVVAGVPSNVEFCRTAPFPRTMLMLKKEHTLMLSALRRVNRGIFNGRRC